MIPRVGTRAYRRSTELSGANVDERTVAATRAAIDRRDQADSARAASPLTQPADAVVIDTSMLSADEVIARVLDEVAARVSS